MNGGSYGRGATALAKKESAMSTRGPRITALLVLSAVQLCQVAEAKCVSLGKSGENSSRAFPDVWVTPEDGESPLSKGEPLASCMQ